ncbi:hypothetical protein PS647_05526 [Pseudomonas fluorescens]|nr:hypothetical protein PS647_05526 [Pseudomonas fluorescens]
MVEKHPQQSIFSTAQGHHGAVFIEQVTGRGVQAPASKGQQAAGFGHHQVRWQHAGASQHRVDPRQQFTGSEWLDQIVVGTHFQAEDAIGFIVAGGEHQHWRGLVLAGAQFAAEQQAIVTRHHDVQHDQVHRGGFQKGAHLPSIRHDRGAQAVLLQVVADQFADFAVIVNDEDVINVIHWAKPLVNGECHTVYRAWAGSPAALCIAVYPACLRIHTKAKKPISSGFVLLCIQAPF